MDFQSDLEAITADQLAGFFVGWPKHPDPPTHLELLRRSDFVELAIEGQRVIGFATAISDGVLSAYIPLLEVLPSQQGRGVGTKLVERLLERVSHLYMVDVLCDDDVAPFYERLGFGRGTGMLRRNRGAQGGTL